MLILEYPITKLRGVCSLQDLAVISFSRLLCKLVRRFFKFPILSPLVALSISTVRIREELISKDTAALQD
jgi:uncharacterized membrane protein